MSDVRITALRTPGKAPRVLTIDVEDWFHVCGDDFYSDPRRWSGFEPRVESTMRNLLDVLDRGGHRGTFFFLGWIAQRYPQLVSETARRGHEVGVHGNLHRRADELTAADFRDDLRRARELVEHAAGTPATSHRAAEWSIRRPTDSAVAELAAEGFRCDASMMPVPPLGPLSNPVGPYRIESDGWGLIELPPLTGHALGRRLPVGGGWPFRLVSEETLARAERAFREEGRPAVFTFHPWEFDPAHPPMDGLASLTRTVHFLKLRNLPERFERWLSLDRCVPIRDAVALLTAA